MVEEFLYFSADDSLVLFGHRPLLLPPTFPGGLAIPLTMTADNEGVNTLPGAQQQKGSSRKPDFRQMRFSETQGDSELLLLAAQSILHAIYHSLTFFSFFGELFYRLDRDINRDERFVPYHPAVVPRLDHVRIARTKICLCAIVHNELQMTRNYIPRVAHLAATGLRNGPYMLGPLPSWLKNLSGDFKVLDGSGLHLAVFELPGLIRGVQALFLTACLCHS